jgi:acyl-CoA reductase-like NAD-dependent aldehyde dehydrogenase
MVYALPDAMERSGAKQMTATQQTISPVDGRLYAERPFAAAAAIDSALNRAARAQGEWARRAIADRAAFCSRFCAALVSHIDEIALELSWQMGRPLAQTPGEVKTCVERAHFMIAAAEEGLAPLDPGPKEGFKRYVKRVPLGVVFVIAPWNYPFLTAVNTIIPAIMAGNAVVLKHAAQTQLVAERFQQAFDEAGLPENVFQHLHISGATAEALVKDARIAHVAFTGSIAVGHAVSRAAADRFISVGLELGGKDPAYVRADADLAFAAETLVDGSFFNSGQSCCGIERIYVHEAVFDEFVARAVAITNQYQLGDPTDPAVNLGPVVSAKAAAFIRAQVAEAVTQGARTLIETSRFSADAAESPYMAPQILVDVTHGMRVMSEETFGPVVGIMKVASDEQAIRLMNDSQYGLTAAIFTADLAAAEAIGARIETGTVFMNRCDSLDPALPWVGVKDTGRGHTLSVWGYEHLTRPQSFNLRLSGG